MANPDTVWIRGATERIMLRARRGSNLVSGDETVRCTIKKAVGRDAVSPGDDVDELFDLEVTFAAEDADDVARWYFKAGSGQTASLNPGKYVIDARISHSSGVIMPNRVIVEVIERVTLPAA